jgi:hypothetical protein
VTRRVTGRSSVSAAQDTYLWAFSAKLLRNPGRRRYVAHGPRRSKLGEFSGRAPGLGYRSGQRRYDVFLEVVQQRADGRPTQVDAVVVELRLFLQLRARVDEVPVLPDVVHEVSRV